MCGLPVDAAGFGAEANGKGAQAPTGVAPEVRAAQNGGGTADVIIRLRAQPDLAAITQRADVDGRRAAENTRRAMNMAGITLDTEIRQGEPIAPAAGEPLLPSWSLESVEAPRTWGEYGVRGAGVVVGIMDGGADGGHPALRSSWRGAPVVTAPAVTLDDSITVWGTADWPSTVQLRTGATVVATAVTALDGKWSAKVPLSLGRNVLTAMATNAAGSSAATHPSSSSVGLQSGRYPVRAGHARCNCASTASRQGRRRPTGRCWWSATPSAGNWHGRR